MSDILNFSRLFLLLKNHLVEHKQRYLYYAAGIFFIGLIIMLLAVAFNDFYGYGNEYHEGDKDFRTTEWEVAQTVIYLSGLGAFAIIFSSVSFVNFNNKGEAIFYLIKPASQLEKWLTEIIVHVFLFFIAYTFIFYLVDIPFTIYVRSAEYHSFLEAYKEWGTLTQQNTKFHPSSLFHFSTLADDLFIAYPICISFYLTGTAFFLYGAVMFNRFSFFKTLIFGFVTAMLYVFYGLLVFKDSRYLFAPAGWEFQSIFKGTSSGENFSYKVEMADHWMGTIFFALMLIVPVALFVCSYFKLKEKEV